MASASRRSEFGAAGAAEGVLRRQHLLPHLERLAEKAFRFDGTVELRQDAAQVVKVGRDFRSIRTIPAASRMRN